MNGRSFGTNVLEAMMAAALEKRAEDIHPRDYANFLSGADLAPRIERFARS